MSIIVKKIHFTNFISGVFIIAIPEIFKSLSISSNKFTEESKCSMR